MTSKKLLIYGQLALGMAIFGSGTPISKLVTDSFPDFLASGLRVLIGALILLPFAFRGDLQLSKLQKRDWYVLAGVSFIGMLVFSVAMLTGMSIVSGVMGSVIMSTTPVVTALGAVLFLDNKMSWQKWMAVVLAMIGVLILQTAGSGEFDAAAGSLILGSLLVFIAVCSEATYTLLGRVASDQLTPVRLAGLGSMGAVVLFLPLAIYQLIGFDLSQPTITDWLALGWWGGGTLALGSIIWYTGVKQVSGSIAAGFMGVMPVSALVLSYVLLGEPFKWIHLAGFGIVLAGVLLISWTHMQDGGH